MNYPDKPGAEGARLVPEAAAGLPRISRDGKTYTFTIRKGIRFSDGSALTAAAFKRAFERAADPKQASPAIAFMHTVVGADARNAGKAARSPASRQGSDPDRPPDAGRPDVPRRSRDAVLRRGQAEHADRRRRASTSTPRPVRTRSSAVRSVVSSCSSGTRSTRATARRTPTGSSTRSTPSSNQSLLQVRAGQADYDAAGLPPTAHDSLSREYGVKKGGNGRYFVNSVISTTYLSLNTIGGPLGKVSNSQGRQHRDRPPGTPSRRRQVRRCADGSDPAAEHAWLQAGGHLPAQGCEPDAGEAGLGWGQLQPDHPAHDVGDARSRVPRYCSST